MLSTKISSTMYKFCSDQGTQIDYLITVDNVCLYLPSRRSLFYFVIKTTKKSTSFAFLLAKVLQMMFEI